MEKLSEYDLGWIVGIIEADGSFTTNGRNPRIAVKMTDFDTIERFAELMGVRVLGPYKYEDAQLGNKPYWQAHVDGQPARDFMSSTRKKFSLRRQAKIYSLLGNQDDMFED